MITTNDLKTREIACLQEDLADKAEDIITVRSKRCFVVMENKQSALHRHVVLCELIGAMRCAYLTPYISTISEA
jgi:hypothetical protein